MAIEIDIERLTIQHTRLTGFICIIRINRCEFQQSFGFDMADTNG